MELNSSSSIEQLEEISFELEECSDWSEEWEELERERFLLDGERLSTVVGGNESDEDGISDAENNNEDGVLDAENNDVAAETCAPA